MSARRIATAYLGGPAAVPGRAALVRAVAGDATLILVTVLAATRLVNPFIVEPFGWIRAVTLTVAAVAVLIRRRFPALALLLALPTHTVPTMACAFSAGFRIISWRRTLGLVLAGLAARLLLTAARHGVDVGLVEALLAWALLVVLPLLAGRYLVQRRTLVRTLRERADQLERERRILIQQTRLRERTRIARDMHDSLGHQLSLIALHTGGLAVSGRLDERERETARLLRETAAAAMTELREIVGVLRQEDEHGAAVEPHALADPHRLAQVDSLVAAARAAGQQVRLDVVGERRPLSLLAEQAAYRGLQEGLTNARKHAPEAPVTMVLRYDADAFVAEVENGTPPGGEPGTAQGTGPGGDPRRRQGLVGLRERARLAGGVLHAGPTPGGYRIALVLPYLTAGHDPATWPYTAPAAPADDRTMADLGISGPAGLDRAGLDRAGLDRAGLDRAGLAPATPPGPLDAFARVRPAEPETPGWLLGAGVGVLVMSVGIGALLVVAGATYLVVTELGSEVSRRTYDSLGVGGPEREVRAALPDRESVLARWSTEDDPPKPGWTCRRHMSKTEVSEAGEPYYYRFCFAGGKLVHKSRHT